MGFKVNTTQGPSEAYSKLASSKLSAKKIVTDRNDKNSNAYSSAPSHLKNSFEKKLEDFKKPNANHPTSTAKFISELER